MSSLAGDENEEWGQGRTVVLGAGVKMAILIIPAVPTEHDSVASTS